MRQRRPGSTTAKGASVVIHSTFQLHFLLLPEERRYLIICHYMTQLMPICRTTAIYICYSFDLLQILNSLLTLALPQKVFSFRYEMLVRCRESMLHNDNLIGSVTLNHFYPSFAW